MLEVYKSKSNLCIFHLTKLNVSEKGLGCNSFCRYCKTFLDFIIKMIHWLFVMVKLSRWPINHNCYVHNEPPMFVWLVGWEKIFKRATKWAQWPQPNTFHNIMIFYDLHNEHVDFEQWLGKVETQEEDLSIVSCEGTKMRQKRAYDSSDGYSKLVYGAFLGILCMVVHGPFQRQFQK